MKKIIFLVSIFLSVSACATKSTKSEDGDRYERLLKVPATVKVLLSESGEPVVDNDAVVVDDGQKLVFVGPENMVVRFPKESPFRKNKIVVKNGVFSQPLDRAKWKKGELLREYKYEIIVGDVVLDPIIIRRRHY